MRLAALTLAAAVLLSAAPALAHQFHSSSTITGSNGNTYQRQGNTSWGNGTFNHQETYTGQNGKSVSRDATTTNTGDGTYNRAVTYTGPNGNTGGYSSTGTYGTGQ